MDSCKKVALIIMKIDENFLSLFNCDCSYYYREHIVYRHFYSMHDALPIIEHFHPDCLQSCVQLMHRDREHAEMVVLNVNLTRNYKG